VGYATAHWRPHFVTESGAFRLTKDLAVDYMRERLGKVLSQTVRKELTALRSFAAWLKDEGHSELGAEVVPHVPKRVTGTNYPVRRRVAAFELSPEQVRGVLRRLPEWSSEADDRFMVRARFLIAYETGLRPSTLDRIRVHTHYRRGSNLLRITKDVDKARYARDVPLTKRARRILDYVLRLLESTHGPDYRGPIFGVHDHRTFLSAAAAQVLPPELAERFAGTHLRSARITHSLELGANMPGVQWQVGHKQISTTARYVKSSFRAALAAIETTRNK
jgi:integrase